MGRLTALESGGAFSSTFQHSTTHLKGRELSCPSSPGLRRKYK